MPERLIPGGESSQCSFGVGRQALTALPSVSCVNVVMSTDHA